MIDTGEVDAVIVTRGDVDIQPIRNTLRAFRKIVVWDNSKGPNMGPFGQFLAACYVATSDVVYFQDDDCVTLPEAIVGLWEPGEIVCNLGLDGHEANYANRPDKLMGFGSCFEYHLIKRTFEKFWEKFPIDHVTWREPGRIFTTMNREKVRVVNVKVTNLPWATLPNRLYNQPEHIPMRDLAVNRALAVRGE